MAKPVVNIDLGGGIIKHTHPEVTTNTSYIDNILSGNTEFYGDKYLYGNIYSYGAFYALSSVIITAEELALSTNYIDLNYNFLSGSPTEDAGIRVKRGNQNDSEIIWNETNDYWSAGIDGSLDRIVVSGDLSPITTNIDSLSSAIDNQTVFSDVAYLRYNAVSGTLNGELGCTLTSPSGWTITQTEVMYYVDPRDASGNSQSLVITIPDASADNLNQTVTFRKPNLAGDLGSITIQTESGQNVGPASTYTFNAPSDFVQLVSNEFEFGAGSYKWRQSYDRRQPINIVEVDVQGYTGYSSIQDAIDAITDADSSTNPYTVAVYPGTYVENIVLKDGVSLEGLGASRYDVKIQPTDGANISWASGTTYSHISNLHVLGTGTNPGTQRLLESSNGTHLIRRCAFDWYATSLSAVEVTCISGAGDSVLDIGDSIGGFYCYGENAVSGSKLNFIRSEDTANIYLDNCNIDMYMELSGNTEIEFFSDNSSYTGNETISNNRISLSVNNVATSGFVGDAYIYEAYTATEGRHFVGNNIRITNTGDSGRAIAYKLNEIGSILRSNNNSIEIEGFGAKYIASVVSGATFNSHFDDTQAISEFIGDGTFNYVFAPSDGNLKISNNLTVENNIIVPLLSGDNTVVISDTNGILKDTTVTINEGPSGGSVLNLIEFTTDPDVSELLVGDMYILDSPSTSGKLWKYFDGTYKYSVEMSRE